MLGEILRQRAASMGLFTIAVAASRPVPGGHARQAIRGICFQQIPERGDNWRLTGSSLVSPESFWKGEQAGRS